MIYGINRYYGHVTSIRKWSSNTPAKTIAKWAEHRSIVDIGNMERTLHYPPRGWKGPDLDRLSLAESAKLIERFSTSPDKDTNNEKSL